MASNFWNTTVACPDRDLLKDKAVHTDRSVRVYDNSIWMSYEEATPYSTVQWDIGPSDNAPKAMPQHEPFANASRRYSFSAAPMLIASDRKQKFAAWIPKLPGLLAAPIGDVGANTLSIIVNFSFHHIDISKISVCARRFSHINN